MKPDKIYTRENRQLSLQLRFWRNHNSFLNI